MRVPLADGGHFLVEVAENEPGLRRASRAGDTVNAAVKSLTVALEPIRQAAESALGVFREAGPLEVEIEFGVRLNAEAGAVIAKTGAEGHMTVKLTWREGAEQG